jgi:predicted Zn-dependent protease
MRAYASALLVFLIACATSPTGRRQLALVPDKTMDKLGATSFEQLKQETPLLKDEARVQYVRCVTHAVLQAAGEKPSDWQVEVFDKPDINAFALPGGHIGIFAGLLKVATNESQLAAIIGHEIAHVQARHGEERVSQALLAQGGLTLTEAFTKGSRAQPIALAALGLGAQYGVLMPFSRAHESEADEIGLQHMAKAGFDPREAVALWNNMAAASDSRAPPQFLSTHPSHETRVQKLRAKMNDAMAAREGAAAACGG